MRISLSRNPISTNESCDKRKEARQVGSEDTFLSVTKYLSDISTNLGSVHRGAVASRDEGWEKSGGCALAWDGRPENAGRAPK